MQSRGEMWRCASRSGSASKRTDERGQLVAVAARVRRRRHHQVARPRPPTMAARAPASASRVPRRRRRAAAAVKRAAAFQRWRGVAARRPAGAPSTTAARIAFTPPTSRDARLPLGAQRLRPPMSVRRRPAPRQRAVIAVLTATAGARESWWLAARGGEAGSELVPEKRAPGVARAARLVTRGLSALGAAAWRRRSPPPVRLGALDAPATGTAADKVNVGIAARQDGAPPAQRSR